MPKLRKNPRWLTGAVAPMAVVLCGCVPVYLVKDLETRTQGSFPAEFTEAGDGMYFVATHYGPGRELVYIPDLAGATGNLAGDLNPGTGSSSPGGLYVRNTRAFFYADDNSDGNTSASQYSLFVTDGPENTTVRLTAPGSSLPSQVFSAFGDYDTNGVLFLRSEAATGVEIWRSDGTVGGTQIVQDIRPGTIGSAPQDMTLFNGFYYFSAAGSDGQRELWRTNGTGATLVKNINPVIQSQPRDFVVFQGKLYFGADEGPVTSIIRGLFSTNGDLVIEDTDTVLVTNKNGDAGFRPEPVAAIDPDPDDLDDDRMFLMAYYDQLWVSNGTEVGTVHVKDFAPDGEGEVPQNFVALDTRVIFHVPTNNGRQLWSSDGTPLGTVFLADNVDTGNTATIMGGFYYYIVGDGLFRTDGTVAGTSQVYSQAGLSPLFLSKVKDTLYFWGNDVNVGGEAWLSDGTPSGTMLAGDYNTATEGSNPANFVRAGAYTFFTADVRGTGRELYRTDGTEGGTALVKDIRVGPTGSIPDNAPATSSADRGGIFYFTGDDGTNGVELWRSDGTSDGTFMVKNINPGAGSSTPFHLYNGPNYLYFRADNGVNGVELWRSDGTLDGTVIVEDINPGIAGSFPEYFATAGGKVCFAATRAAEGKEPWCSDGTLAGTDLLRDIRSGTSSSNAFDEAPGVVNGTIYFGANDNLNGDELWSTDGTPGGTARVSQINTAANGSSSPQRFAVMNGAVFFTAFNGTRWDMYRSAGGAPTVMTSTIAMTGMGPSPGMGVVAGNTLFFVATSTANGPELWKTAGTVGSVPVQVGEIQPGPSTQTSINYVTALGNVVYFSANDGVNGIELWMSDGTTTEIVTGDDDARSSSPLHLKAIGTRVYLNRNDAEFGTEPFYVEP